MWDGARPLSSTVAPQHQSQPKAITDLVIYNIKSLAVTEEKFGYQNLRMQSKNHFISFTTQNTLQPYNHAHSIMEHNT